MFAKGGLIGAVFFLLATLLAKPSDQIFLTSTLWGGLAEEGGGGEEKKKGRGEEAFQIPCAVPGTRYSPHKEDRAFGSHRGEVISKRGLNALNCG